MARRERSYRATGNPNGGYQSKKNRDDASSKPRSPARGARGKARYASAEKPTAKPYVKPQIKPTSAAPSTPVDPNAAPPVPRTGRASFAPHLGQAKPNRPAYEDRHASPPKPSPATRSRSGGTVPEEFADASRGERLQRVLADAGVASRRACEQLIADGHVTVNGKFVTALPAWIDPARDRVHVRGSFIKLKRDANDPAGQLLYVILHKPRRVITTTSDPQGRTSVLDMVELQEQFPELANQRLFPVGRLDADSSGLLLLTNDGELANRLTHPRYGVPKRYLVLVRGDLSEEDLQRLRKGMILTAGARKSSAETEHSAPAAPSPILRASKQPRPKPEQDIKLARMEHVTVISRQHDQAQGDRTLLSVTLREGQNREIRRLLARLGYNVRRLRRVAIGPLELKTLPVGKWRMLTPGEVQSLRKAVGVKVQKKSPRNKP